MRRFLSIAICSVVLLSSASAFDGRDGGRIQTWSNNVPPVGTTTILSISPTGFFYPDYDVYRSGVFVTMWSPDFSMSTSIRTLTTTTPGNWEFWMNNSSAGRYLAYSFTRLSNGAVTNFGGYWTPPPSDPVVTNSFSWTFGPEWGGTILQIRATNGTALGTWGLPATIGPGGYVLSTSIVTNESLLTGAQVFLDGVSAAALAMASTNSNLNGFADRPGYALSFGPDYQGGEWQVRRSDGSVAATGSAATFGTVASGRVTLLPEGSTGSIWTRVPAGDGMGSVWVNSGITVSGNNVTTYNFSSAPAPNPAPTPNLPTNAPAPPITNAPAPAPTPGTNSVGPAPVSTNDVTVDVDTLSEIETDDGEQGVLDQVTSMSEKFRQAIENFKGAFDNVALTFNEFRKFTLGGVGTNCTLNIGPVSLNLAGIVPDAVRSGMKLFILLVGVFAAIRYTWETFA